MSVLKMQRNSLDRPHDDGRVEVHLLMTGFMDGYTRWIIEDEDDSVEDADRAGNDDTGQDE